MGRYDFVMGEEYDRDKAKKLIKEVAEEYVRSLIEHIPEAFAEKFVDNIGSELLTRLIRDKREVEQAVAKKLEKKGWTYEEIGELLDVDPGYANALCSL